MTWNDFFHRHTNQIRRSVQAGFGFFTLFIGYRFFLFYEWTWDQGAYTARPAAVEGFLPISALMGLKQLVLTGRFDPIHPAGLVIFMAALTIALVARKGFCGWICPVGFVSHLAQWLGGKLRILVRVPDWLGALLSGCKYLVLAFFLYAICWEMDGAAIAGFLESPYNLAADAKLLQMFLSPSGTTLAVLSFLVGISLWIPNFWCRFLCPYGALLGLIALASPLRVVRHAANCTGCRRCDQQCPGGIRVSDQKNVRSPECIGCLACVAACPQTGCLRLRGPGKSAPPSWLIPLLTVAILLGFWLTARLTDHWQSRVSPVTFQQMYLLTDERAPGPR